MEESLDARPDRTSLIEESILPTRAGQRQIGILGYAWIRVGIAVTIATCSLGATGIHGTHLPAVSRGVVAAMWFGIQTYLGALALNGIGEYFPGFSNWFLWYAVFAVVQVANTMLGIKSVERLAALAAPAFIAIPVWMYFTLEGIAETKGLNIWSFRADAQGLALQALLVLVVLAQWSTNNSANLIPAALTFVNPAPRVITCRSGVALAGVIGFPPGFLLQSPAARPGFHAPVSLSEARFQ